MEAIGLLHADHEYDGLTLFQYHLKYTQKKSDQNHWSKSENGIPVFIVGWFNPLDGSQRLLPPLKHSSA